MRGSDILCITNLNVKEEAIYSFLSGEEEAQSVNNGFTQYGLLNINDLQQFELLSTVTKPSQSI